MAMLCNHEIKDILMYKSEVNLIGPRANGTLYMPAVQCYLESNLLPIAHQCRR